MMWRLLTFFCCLAIFQLSATTNVLAFSGSTRKDSANKKLVNVAASLARQMSASVTTISLDDYPIPFYDADLETKNGMPENVKKIRQMMIQSDVIFIASPEYNGSVSALLKNIIDWASRNENGGSSRDAFRGKRFLIMSASPGASGGARGLKHLREVVENIGGTVLKDQFSLPDAYNAFDDAGDLKNSIDKTRLRELIKSSLNLSPVSVAAAVRVDCGATSGCGTLDEDDEIADYI